MNDDFYSEPGFREKLTVREQVLGVLLVLVLIFIAAGLVNRAFKSPKIYYDFIPPPVQSPLSGSDSLTITLSQDSATLTKLAAYEVNAVVKSVKRYKDPMGSIAPLDFALGWGPLNSKAMDEHIRYSQSGRWYHYLITNTTEVDATTVAQNSSNHHLIPEDDRIRKQLNRIRVNDYVVLKGYLVNISYQDRTISTSTSRSDTGSGACEIMLVTEVESK